MNELHQAARRLARRPLFALAAVGILALGIGANTAIFSLMEAVVLRPLPMPHPDRLTYVRERDPDGSLDLVGYETYLDLAARVRGFASLAVSSQRNPTLGLADGARTLDALGVTHTWLPTLGVEPALGRNFTAEEDRPGAPRVVILGHAIWTSRFAGDAAIVGRTIDLDDTPYEVVGVLPAGLDRLLGPGAGRRLDLVVPLRYAVGQSWACRDCRHLNAIARLAPGVSRAAAGAELDAAIAALRSAYPDKYPTSRGGLETVGDVLTGKSRALLATLFAGVALVLLLAVANVAALLAVRTIERARELAIRRSLGADRSRLVAAALGESALLTAAGAVAGLALARPALAALVRLAPSFVPRLDGVGLSLPVLAFTLVTSAVVALAAGVAPAIAHLRAPARAVLATGGGPGMSRRRRRGLALLITAELALALVVVFAAALLGRSFERLLAEDPGFRPDGVVVADVDVNGPRYGEDAAVNAFFDRALERVMALPGVTAAGWTSQLPLGGSTDSFGLRFADKPEIRLDEQPAGDRFAVTPGYFAALGIRLVQGRFLLDSDRLGAEPVILVSRRLAEKIWPGESALGKRIQVGGTEAPWRRVVGVVEDVLHQGLDRPSAAQFYVAEAQWLWADPNRVLVVRSKLLAAQLARSIAAAVGAVDPKCPVEHLAAMTDVVARSTGGRRFATSLWSAFALLALLLAATGTYSLFARQVAMRRRELAMRSALGARPTRLAAELGGEAARWLLAAAALAVPLLWLVGRLVSAQLWKVPSTDPLALATAFAVVATMAALACLQPARRAARVDPARVLRDE
jgi:putative ABC transport system permease protein